MISHSTIFSILFRHAIRHAFHYYAATLRHAAALPLLRCLRDAAHYYRCHAVYMPPLPPFTLLFIIFAAISPHVAIADYAFFAAAA